ncbi:MAG TPA: 6-phospho-beta-glucosidase [Actinomycetota bacterium]|nr:6-phospho-beta-glucosidase [Actinomycetota bacterium]
MKLAIVGGGGFRVPFVVEALDTARDAIGLEEIVLHDVDDERLLRMELVVRGMRQAADGNKVADLRRTTDLGEAVEGAGAVFAAIRVGGTAGRIVDEEVPLALGVLGQETVGPAGIAFAIRTIPAMCEIARTVAARAPSAWFLNFTNPAGVVTQALRPILGDRVIGICDSPSALRGRIAAALGREEQDVEVDYAGLNHLGWVLGVRLAGREVLPRLLADDRRLGRIEEVRLAGVDAVRRLGAIPNEYLVYHARADEIAASFREEGSRGTLVHAQTASFERAPFDRPAEAFRAWRRAVDARHGTYMAEARTPTVSEAAGEEYPVFGYGDVATGFLRATVGRERSRQVLDVANRGRLPFLADDDVIETTCDVSPDAVVACPGRPLPEEAAALVRRVKQVERLTIRAATEGRADVALEAIAAHPLVPSYETAERILAGYLERHDNLRPILR